jgi:hypothetical protein
MAGVWEESLDQLTDYQRLKKDFAPTSDWIDKYSVYSETFRWAYPTSEALMALVYNGSEKQNLV